MDFTLTYEQEMLRASTREFLEVECPKSLVQEMETDDTGFSPDLWQKMADLGWLGLPFPEQYGGAGLSFQDVATLLEEMGRFILPGPFFSSVVLCGQAILEAGTDEQKADFLTKIASGKLIMALALTESSAQYQASDISVRADLSSHNYVINGTKMFVSDGQAADHFIVAARTTEETNPHEGISLFLVNARSPGITVNPLLVMGIDKQAEVIFKDVQVPLNHLLGPVDGGWSLVEKLLVWGAVGKCAESVGGAQAALDMTVEYAKTRQAFGQPIGSFQAIQHHCANMLTDVDTSRYLMQQAAWLVAQGEFNAPEISKAKAWIGDAYPRVTALAHQCHGAIAFTKEMDIHLYHKRAKVNEVLFG
ncbi:MAG: acyl-CoA dehydrogenase family protein, partial [Dehalococcoidia bacterium]|nr:acyl-CoA dehydrogenase family protein [Dehalococcoidia bacterium]